MLLRSRASAGTYKRPSYRHPLWRRSCGRLQKLHPVSHIFCSVSSEAEHSPSWRKCGILQPVFFDLPQSAKEACRFYSGSHDESLEQQWLFWLQFQDPTRRVILGDMLKQLEEVQRLARRAMEEIFKVLWQEEPLPTTCFELSWRLQEGRARIWRWQKSACHEGAWQA